MKKTAVIGAVAVVVAATSYYTLSYVPAQKAAAEAVIAAQQAEAEAAAKLKAEQEAAAAAAAKAAEEEAAAKAKAAEEAAAKAAADAKAAEEAAAAAKAAEEAAAAKAVEEQAPAGTMAFYPEELKAAVAASTLEATIKDELTKAIEAAQSDMSLIAPTLEKVQAALAGAAN